MSWGGPRSLGALEGPRGRGLRRKITKANLLRPCAVRHGGRSTAKGLRHDLLLNGRVVSAELGNAVRVDVGDLESLVGLDVPVVDAALVLSHQDVVLFALLVSLDLLVQLAYVLPLFVADLLGVGLLGLLAHRDFLRHLVRVKFVRLLLQHLDALLLRDLEAEGLAGIRLGLEVNVSLPRGVFLLLALALLHAFEHAFLVALGGLLEVALDLVVAQSLVLSLVALLEVLKLEEVLRALFVVHCQFLVLHLREDTVLFLRVVPQLLPLLLLRVQRFNPAALVVEHLLLLQFVAFCDGPLLVEELLPSHLTELFLLDFVCNPLFFLLLKRLLGPLLDAIPDFLPLFFVLKEAPLLQLLLRPNHLHLVAAVAVSLGLDVALPLQTLLIEVGPEGLLVVPLLGHLVLLHALLHLVLMAQNGAPLVEDFLALLDRQVAPVDGVVVLAEARQERIARLRVLLLLRLR